MNINPSNSAPLRRATSFLFIAALLAGCATPPPGGSGRDVAEPLNYEGLETVSARRMDIAQVRPGTDFSLYNAVLMRPPELAYRTPDRSRQEFPLSGEQQAAAERVLLAQPLFRDGGDALHVAPLGLAPRGAAGAARGDAPVHLDVVGEIPFLPQCPGLRDLGEDLLHEGLAPEAGIALGAPGLDGHSLMNDPHLWGDGLQAYLRALDER